MRVLLTLALSMLAVAPGAGPDAPSRLPDAIPGAGAVEGGAQLYAIYCKSCHGVAGRGDGPAAATLDPRPADLTLLSRGNGGEFPTARAIMSIDGRTRIPGHDGGQMPVFGLSLQESGSDANQEPQVREKIQDLVAYLRSIQRRVSD